MSREERGRKIDCSETRDVGRQSEAKRDGEEEEGVSERRGGKVTGVAKGCYSEQQHQVTVYTLWQKLRKTERGQSIKKTHTHTHRLRLVKGGL